MFQSFDAPATPVTGNRRLAALRAEIAKAGADALLIPHGDEQRNEYLPACNERLAWLTGFTGSAGAALVLADRAVLFVDGRYTLQASQQVDDNHWQFESLVDTPPAKWLEAQDKRLTLAYDPWLHSPQDVAALEKAADLVPLGGNPVDTVWADRPAPPQGAVSVHPLKFAGRSAEEKRADMDAALAKAGGDICVLSDATSVNWLFNIRGKDVSHMPLALAHAILCKGEMPLIFIDPAKLDDAARDYLDTLAERHDPSDLIAQIKAMSAGKSVMLDPAQNPHAMFTLVEDAGGTVLRESDPVTLPKACKNEAELEGARAAHRRDGAAVSSFLAWMEGQKPGTVSEIEAAERLENFRRNMAGNMPLMEVAFDTISGSGPNGAIVHYRVNEGTNRTAQAGELYLVDSGGQYQDGTTDITRTIAIGDVTEETKRCYTLVLKGHLAFGRARFPKGTRGMDLDALARNPLWQTGLDYGHGTGHGVGSYLGVHEGPQNISKRGTAVLEAGMIVSNEPGYYRSGEFGIRIENLEIVTEPTEIAGGDIAMHGFETLTLCPYARDLIATDLLDVWEIERINAYHAWVLEELSPRVNEAVKAWLVAACAPL
jgi:Xaa-Pro aminopeptidase